MEKKKLNNKTMTNEEKALEIVDASTLRDPVDAFGLVLKMAQWKEQQMTEKFIQWIRNNFTEREVTWCNGTDNIIQADFMSIDEGIEDLKDFMK